MTKFLIIRTYLLILGDFSFLLAQTSADVTIVQTSYGQLEGFVHRLDGGQFIDVFQGIPYAQPPVGELRFEKPLEPLEWKGLRAAKEPSAACVPDAQPSAAGENFVHEEKGKKQLSQPPFSEDCLHLNVFAPHQQRDGLDSSAKSKLLPILVIVHGGAFQVGSAHRYDYRDLGEKFVSRGIVVVTVQYRLGVLGFASTGDKVLPGNLGLWDLAAALRWIRAEAAAWGADGRRITALGYGAGAAAVSGLAMSPYTRQMFQQAVQMSGSPLAQMNIGTFVANDTLALAKVLNCSAADSHSEEVKECLRGKTVEQLHRAIIEIGPSRSDVNFAKFTSREDGIFFPRELVELIHEAPPKRTLMGHCRLDSLAFTLIQQRDTQFAVPPNRRPFYGQADFDLFVRQVVAKSEYFGEKAAAKVQQEIIDFFTAKHKMPANKDSKFYLERYNMVLNDLQFVMPFVWESRLKANWGWPLFLYEFAWTEPALFPTNVPVQEAFHLLDHDLLFEGGQLEPKSEQASLVTRMLIEAVVNFIQKGNPSTKDVLWVPASAVEPMRHLVIDGPKPRMKELVEDLPRLKFWHQLTEKHREFNLIKGTFGSERIHDEL